MNSVAAVESVLRFEAVTKEFVVDWRDARWRALDEVSFAVPSGSVCTLVGPNGSGKSTALRIAAGLTRPTGGRCCWKGDPVLRPRVGYLPESVRLPLFLRTDEALVQLARISGRSIADAIEQAARALARTGLSAMADRRIGDLSKGLRQRLALAQALMDEPELLLLDEPADGLDPHALEMLENIVMEERGRGATILLSSHFLPRVEAISDRCVLLVAGRVVFSGDAAAVALRGGMENVYRAEVPV
jgi:ABC-type multidrug transport system ATPase subunit